MDEKILKTYNGLLVDKIISMFNVSKANAEEAVKDSAIQRLIREEPEFVDITPIEYWAEEVHKEMIDGKVKVLHEEER